MVRRFGIVAFTVLVGTILLVGGCQLLGVGPEEDTGENPTPTPKSQLPAPPARPGDFFPLTQGSTWKYEGHGNEFASFTRQVLYVKSPRAQVQEDNGGTVMARVYEITDSAVRQVFAKGESYEKENYLDQSPQEPVTILKAPLTLGANWTSEDGSIREIIGVDAVVDTPAGRFEDCLRVKVSRDESTHYEYFKEAVGLVKREFLMEAESITSVLAEYQIK